MAEPCQFCKWPDCSYLVDLDGTEYFSLRNVEKGGKYTSEWENSFETDRCLRVKDTTLAWIVNEMTKDGIESRCSDFWRGSRFLLFFFYSKQLNYPRDSVDRGIQMSDAYNSLRNSIFELTVKRNIM